jgi:alpha-beta hydrolase superfamily lysophospholipase
LEAYKLKVESNLYDIEPQTGYFDTYDGSRLYTASWIPSDMKVLIIMVHGLGEHIQRFQLWSSQFYSNKIGVVGFDLRGHGHNKGQYGRMNYFDTLKDIDAFVMKSHERFPFIPKIIYGQSMGGNLVLRYTIDYKPKVAGVISTSPWLKLVKMPSPQIINIMKVIGKFLPFITVPNGLNPGDLSRDPEIGKAYTADPLVHNKISPDLFLKISDSGNFILQNKHKINVPLLLMHGTGDNITSSKASTDFANFTSEYTTLRLWKNNYHELHNEFDKADIFQYILRWIEQLPTIQQR